MVVQIHVPVQRLRQVLQAVETVHLEHIGNAAIEALDHAIGARRSGFGQAELDIELLACLIKHVSTTGFRLAAGKQPIGELLAVVGQDLGDSDRAGLVQCHIPDDWMLISLR